MSEGEEWFHRNTTRRGRSLIRRFLDTSSNPQIPDYILQNRSNAMSHTSSFIRQSR
jgi:hypothetical protein